MPGKGQRKFLNAVTVIAIIAVIALLVYSIKSGLWAGVLDPFPPPGR